MKVQLIMTAALISSKGNTVVHEIVSLLNDKKSNDQNRNNTLFEMNLNHLFLKELLLFNRLINMK